VPPARAQGIDMTQGGPIQITARDGIDWRQADQVVIAKGDTKAVRGNVTVTADRLYAWYRRKSDATGSAPQAQPVSTGQQPRPVSAGPQARPASTDPQAQPASTGPTSDTETEGNEVYRMRAEGHVHIYTETDQAWGDQATYDLDEAVLVMTGHALKLTTPDDTLTARDTLEYWSQKHMAVARGDAVVVTNDARRISADTLVAYTVETPAHPGAPQSASGPDLSGKPTGGQTVPAASQTSAGVGPRTAGAQGAQPAQPASDSMAAMVGKLQRVEAFNNVTVRTLTDIVTGDRAVYVPDTGIAHLGGHVRITRGENQVNGSEAVVNQKTGIATLLSGDNGRVSGLVVPNDQSNPPPSDVLSRPAHDQPKPGATP
jgi:lipopolysaccharide export system protein LptA